MSFLNTFFSGKMDFRSSNNFHKTGSDSQRKNRKVRYSVDIHKCNVIMDKSYAFNKQITATGSASENKFNENSKTGNSIFYNIFTLSYV